MTDEHQRLRAHALSMISDRWKWDHLLDGPDRVLTALSGYTDDAWRPWQDITDAKDMQWFVWRDPDVDRDIHVDRVMVDADGRIEGKAGCGLDYYPECQPCRFADDVIEALKGVGRWEV